MDGWIARHLGKAYDKDAEWAKTGEIDTTLLTALLNEPFLQQAPPKSTGRELFNLPWLDKILAKHTALLPQNVQRTLAEFTVQSIANELKLLQKEDLPNFLLVCGGGARNPLLMQRLHELLPTWEVSDTTTFGLDPDYVEAAAFAWLAYRRLTNQPSNLPSVTGAKRAVSLGVIFPK